MANDELKTSTFLIALEAPSHVPRYVNCPDPSKYSYELDDVRSVLTDLCDILADVEGTRLVVCGFDAAPWRASVRADLPVVLEQLPDLLRGFRARTTVELDFFEQGLERAVRFSGAGPTLKVTCVSRQTTWSPRIQAIAMTREATYDMFRGLADTFIRVARDACPRLVEHPWIVSWASAVQQDFEVQGN